MASGLVPNTSMTFRKGTASVSLVALYFTTPAPAPSTGIAADRLTNPESVL